MNPSKLKEEGNKLFQKGLYREALERYTEAIDRSPDTCVLYTNRAICHLKLSKWQMCIQDCKRALEIDASMLKAYFYMGQALSELEQYDDALYNLFKSEELNKQLNSSYGDEIKRKIKFIKRKRWNHMEEQRIKQEIELQTYIKNLMQIDRDNKIAQSLENNIIMDNDSQQTHENDSRIKEINEDYTLKLNELNHLFDENDERRRKREIPEYLCDKISFEVIQEPVITPSGITYNRAEIEQHIQRIGHFDPITRVPLTIDKLIPNLLVKEIVEDFVAKNPWIDGVL